MILLADSGSTKTHWCLMAASGQRSDFLTDGINPVMQGADDVYNTVSLQLLPKLGPLLWAGRITHIFFYGAGCIPERCGVISEALSRMFKHAEVAVASDTLGAARALCGHERGVACILGTGSASCMYDGRTIEWNVPSLGYILGDEGSGAVLGRRLVGDLLKNQLGEDLKQQFLRDYNTSMADIIEHVYRQPLANRWLAGLSRFCADHLDDRRIYNLVYDHLLQFVRRNVVQYMADGPLPVGFVGSIAYYYQPVLKQVMEDEGLTLGRVLHDPIDGLCQYHKADLVPTTE